MPFPKINWGAKPQLKWCRLDWTLKILEEMRSKVFFVYCLFWGKKHILLLLKAQKAKDCLFSVSYQNFEKGSMMQVPMQKALLKFACYPDSFFWQTDSRGSCFSTCAIANPALKQCLPHPWNAVSVTHPLAWFTSLSSRTWGTWQTLSVKK